MSSWGPQWVGCGRGIISDDGAKVPVPNHPIITAGESSKIRCLICSYAEEVKELQKRIDEAVALLHEGKVVQAHEALRASKIGAE